MLSVAKIGRSSWRYYQQTVAHDACEYYLGTREAPGLWHGRGLSELGLRPGAEVCERELEALFARGLHPVDGSRLGRAWRVDGVTGFDLTFSAPKSVSVLWALGGGEVGKAVSAAQWAAVAAALDFVDAHASFSRVGAGGRAQAGTAGLAAAVFDHRSSRAGDPQLHSHALVVNKARCADGGWRTLDGHEIYAAQKAAGAVYQAALRAELTGRLNVGWAPVSEHAQAEIAGLPAGLLALFSKRTAQVAAEADPVIARLEAELHRPLSSAERVAVRKTAVVKTRPAKEQVAVSLLHQRWRGEAAAAGWDQRGLLAAVRAAARVQPTPTLGFSGEAQFDRLLAEAVAAVGARTACFARAELVVEIAARLPAAGLSADRARGLVEAFTDAALANPAAVRLLDADPVGAPRASDARYASRATLALEARILDRAQRGRGAGIAAVDPATVARVSVDAGLDATQAAAIIRLATSGDSVSVLVAPAGTGKTTALGAAATAWGELGHPVLGFAPTARAAAELAA
ncbi:MAG: MobF family relaxase, partial [Mycobacteriales bacterium]